MHNKYTTNLKTLELRRLHYDLVMCYKIVFNIIQLRFSDFFVYIVLCPLVVIHINCMPLSMPDETFLPVV